MLPLLLLHALVVPLFGAPTPDPPTTIPYLREYEVTEGGVPYDYVFVKNRDELQRLLGYLQAAYVKLTGLNGRRYLDKISGVGNVFRIPVVPGQEEEFETELGKFGVRVNDDEIPKRDLVKLKERPIPPPELEWRQMGVPREPLRKSQVRRPGTQEDGTQWKETEPNPAQWRQTGIPRDNVLANRPMRKGALPQGEQPATQWKQRGRRPGTFTPEVQPRTQWNDPRGPNLDPARRPGTPEVQPRTQWNDPRGPNLDPARRPGAFTPEVQPRTQWNDPRGQRPGNPRGPNPVRRPGEPRAQVRRPGTSTQEEPERQYKEMGIPRGQILNPARRPGSFTTEVQPGTQWNESGIPREPSLTNPARRPEEEEEPGTQWKPRSPSNLTQEGPERQYKEMGIPRGQILNPARRPGSFTPEVQPGTQWNETGIPREPNLTNPASTPGTLSQEEEEEPGTQRRPSNLTQEEPDRQYKEMGIPRGQILNLARKSGSFTPEVQPGTQWNETGIPNQVRRPSNLTQEEPEETVIPQGSILNPARRPGNFTPGEEPETQSKEAGILPEPSSMDPVTTPGNLTEEPRKEGIPIAPDLVVRKSSIAQEEPILPKKVVTPGAEEDDPGTGRRPGKPASPMSEGEAEKPDTSTTVANETGDGSTTEQTGIQHPTSDKPDSENPPVSKTIVNPPPPTGLVEQGVSDRKGALPPPTTLPKQTDGEGNQDPLETIEKPLSAEAVEEPEPQDKYPPVRQSDDAPEPPAKITKPLRVCPLMQGNNPNSQLCNPDTPDNRAKLAELLRLWSQMIETDCNQDEGQTPKTVT